MEKAVDQNGNYVEKQTSGSLWTFQLTLICYLQLDTLGLFVSSPLLINTVSLSLKHHTNDYVKFFPPECLLSGILFPPMFFFLQLSLFKGIVNCSVSSVLEVCKGNGYSPFLHTKLIKKNINQI